MDKKEILIDDRIEFDTSKLPQMMQDLIQELEEYNKKNDWIMYYGVSETLESWAKQCLLDGIINEQSYELLINKYC